MSRGRRGRRWEPGTRPAMTRYRVDCVTSSAQHQVWFVSRICSPSETWVRPAPPRPFVSEVSASSSGRQRRGVEEAVVRRKATLSKADDVRKVGDAARLTRSRRNPSVRSRIDGSRRCFAFRQIEVTSD